MTLRFARGLAVAVALLLAPSSSRAMPGVYVGRSGEKLVNRATHVVVMRDATRTVVAMQPDYEGPAEDFAIVIPVPEGIHKESVRTLPSAVFERLERLDAPRLVEYWEADPCRAHPAAPRSTEAGAGPMASDPGARAEAKLAPPAYAVHLLDAHDVGAVSASLARDKLKLPAAAEAPLDAFVKRGWKLLVVHVDASKLEMQKRGDRSYAVLPPLRFHFDSDSFRVPLHIGVLSSDGVQDVVVHVLGRSRYEAANVVNVAVPTNIDVTDQVRRAFPSFYATLFDKTAAMSPGAAITEYAWDARSCDPCTGPPLDDADLLTLGADVLPSVSSEVDMVDPQLLSALGADAGGGARHRYYGLRSFVLTRLHLRYPKESADDLYLKEGPPISGGGEPVTHPGAHASVKNAFQARYVIRHAWTGPIACAFPMRGVWTGPPAGAPAPLPEPALDLASAPRDAKLGALVAGDVPELGIVTPHAPPAAPEPPPKKSGCNGCSMGAPLAALLVCARRRRRYPRRAG